MKIVHPTSYDNAYNRAMDLESKYKTSKKASKSCTLDDDSPEGSNDEESSKKVHALQKDLQQMMRELKVTKGRSNKNEEGEVSCMDCKEVGQTKGSCPKKSFYDICQVMGRSTKECPYNMRTRPASVVHTRRNLYVKIKQPTK